MEKTEWQVCPLKEKLEDHIKKDNEQYAELKSHIEICVNHVIEVQAIKNENFEGKMNSLEKDIKELKKDVVELKTTTKNTNAILKWVLGIMTALIIAGAVAFATDLRNHIYPPTKVEQQLNE